jgi:hypothetical protein
MGQVTSNVKTCGGLIPRKEDAEWARQCGLPSEAEEEEQKQNRAFNTALQQASAEDLDSIVAELISRGGAGGSGDGGSSSSSSSGSGNVTHVRLDRLTGFGSIDHASFDHWQDEHVVKLVKAFGMHFKTLDVSNCAHLTDAALNAVGKHCPELVEFNCSFCKNASDSGLEAVAAGCGTISIIRCTDCHGVFNEGLRRLLEKYPRLRIDPVPQDQ